MNVIYSVKDYVTNVFDFQQSSVSGAIDIVTVQHEDASLHCTPFHVHFGKMMLKSNLEKQVTIVVNGRIVEGVHMKLGAAGEAFFVDPVHEPVEKDYNTSPLSSPITAAVTSDPMKLPPLSPLDSTGISRNGGDATADNKLLEKPEWHDAYRLVPDDRLPAKRDSNYPSFVVPSERLTWGWGALPRVHRSASAADVSSGETTDNDTEEELPMMVKSDSVYFDAVENEQPVNSSGYFSDHPCMSLCGHLLGQAESQNDVHAIFSEHIVTFEFFRENPTAILMNPNLMVLVDGKICSFNAETQAYLVARVLFPNSPPLSLTSSNGSHKYRPEMDKKQSEFWCEIEEEDEQECGEEDNEGDPIDGQPSIPAMPTKQWTDTTTATTTSGYRRTATKPIGESTNQHLGHEPFFRKSLQPSHDELVKMKLRYGTNDVEFVVNTVADGDIRVRAKLYLWPISAKIVIAEIDGAISRSASVNGGGMFSKMLPGKENGSSSTFHPGALEFYSQLARNGYRIVYLTSHGLSQANMMRDILQRSSSSSSMPSSKNGTSLVLPNGPVLLSPDQLLVTSPSSSSNNSSIYARNFKVAALNGIRALFPTDVNPFYAAFGKTYVDSVVFTQVGVFPGKVFLVDEGDGRLRHRSMMNYQESYQSLMELVDKMFPPICSPSVTKVVSLEKMEEKEKAKVENGNIIVEDSSPLIRRVDSVMTDELLSEIMSSHVRTRSLVDEAYNDVNFWRIRPGTI